MPVLASVTHTDEAVAPNAITKSTKGMSRGQLKKLKAKNKPAGTKHSTNGVDDIKAVGLDDKNMMNGSSSSSQGIRFVLDDFESDDTDIQGTAGMEAFAEVFAKFQASTDEDGTGKGEISGKGEVIYSDDDMPSETDSDSPKAELSKRKQRKMSRLSVAELKRLVKKPEVVDWVDVTAQDPKLLVQLKSYRNTVPIPAHWSQKRDYLQGKRGIEKPAFQLPSYIADTGIATQRDAVKEKEGEQSLKQKTRERVQPKMGKIDIDYQKLHDAFFKFQKPPALTTYGEMYYEGKEFETKLKEKRPGDLSDELKEALSIPPLAPPPWLIAMQRYGPPPSYPNLKVAGLNHPIPEGAQWGFHPGGWGKPPTDEYGRPLYGDVFGTAPKVEQNPLSEPISKEWWGELMSEEEDEEEEDESSDEGTDDESGGHHDGTQTPSGMETPSGLASITSTVPGGLETPDFLELRKRREGTSAATDADEHKSLYQVIPERNTTVSGFMGSERAYDVKGISQRGHNVSMLGQEDRYANKRKGGVEVTLDPSELEGLSDEQLRQRYEESRRQGSGTNGGSSSSVAHLQSTGEDLSDMVAQESAKRRKQADARATKAREEKFKF